MLDAPVHGTRRRGRQKTRWKDSCKKDMESIWLKEEDVLDWATPDDWKSPRRRIMRRRRNAEIVLMDVHNSHAASQPRQDREE